MTTSPPDGSERRRHTRVALTRNGRFLAPDGTEHVCTIRDMSLGGIALISETPVASGNRIIVYLDDLAPSMALKKARWIAAANPAAQISSSSLM
jgi:hypothetical protein